MDLGRMCMEGSPLGTDFMNIQCNSNFSSEGSSSAGVLLIELNQSKLIYKPQTDSW